MDNIISDFQLKYCEIFKQDLQKVQQNKDNNLLHHIWRCELQMKNGENIAYICNIVCDTQNVNGSWVDFENKDCVGITLVSIHRLIWSLELLTERNENNDLVERITKSIYTAIMFTLNNEYDLYNNGDSPSHGVIDNLHYLLMSYFYTLKFNNKFKLCTIEEIKLVEQIYNKNIQWLLSKQELDGGWHEIDRVRDRVGVTSDAVRGLLLDKRFYNQVNQGIVFIINNQNSYRGYWSCGNIDKVIDALKTLMSALHLIKDDAMYIKCEESIKNGIRWLLANYESRKQLDENDYDLFTVLIDYEKVILKKEGLDYI